VRDLVQQLPRLHESVLRAEALVRVLLEVDRDSLTANTVSALEAARHELLGAAACVSDVLHSHKGAVGG
jgi:hypothetical protein